MMIELIKQYLNKKMLVTMTKEITEAISIMEIDREDPDVEEVEAIRLTVNKYLVVINTKEVWENISKTYPEETRSILANIRIL